MVGNSWYGELLPFNGPFLMRDQGYTSPNIRTRVIKRSWSTKNLAINLERGLYLVGRSRPREQNLYDLMVE
jgi:hypothetical protein